MSDDSLPVSTNGNLPANYAAARTALEQCSRIDECRDWADKAAALKSYAKQAEDHSLYTLAQRIQNRATRRYGELLKQIPRGDQATRYGQEGAHPPVNTRSRAAREAGLSEHQAKQGLRVASIPAAEFEAALESENPPTVTQLAALGTVSRPVVPVSGLIPADPRQVAEVTTLLRQVAAFCSTADPAALACAPGIDTQLIHNYVGVIERWLDSFITRMPGPRLS